MAKQNSRRHATRTKALAGRSATATASVVDLSAFTAADIEAELKRRRRSSARLVSRRERLLADIAAIDKKLLAAQAMLNGHSGAKGNIGTSRRHRNAESLADSLAGVLKGKELSVTEATRAVQTAGYRTSAANFRVIVNATLLKDARFKNVARGIYTLKKTTV